ncbi:MAG TPA: alpha-amylase family glycosyl hydrolase [Gaiellaceae bacterium]|nr:alpha-amylase family glycosyl hydrolase [Gaiellaceae bacterium]
MEAEWWRDAVFYEIYVRSFSDSDGDGLGDLPGIRSRLPYLRELGVDALWLTPFYPSPDADHGYDVADYADVDPRFGTLADFDAVVADAHALGIRVTVDLVPNHTSDRHRWFTEHPDYYVWADRPNNWPSHFGGPAWTFDATRGKYYLHLFAPEQPDLDWHNPAVKDEFEPILRFWLDRGVDGFRIDVGHSLYKHPELPDEPEPFPLETPFSSDWRLAVDQPEVHGLYREWRVLLDSYPGERMLVGEIVFSDPRRIAEYVRSDELHLSFNFGLLHEEWRADRLRMTIDRTLAALGEVGASSSWVLENHDVARLATRYGSLRGARAGALLLLALPGAAFLYAGQELGLDEVELPDEARRDPIFLRTNGERLGRDGCRVPLPWSGDAPPFGFTTGEPWLPQPAGWSGFTVEAQAGDPASTLALYRAALAARPRGGALAWRESPPGTLVFERDGLLCLVNVSAPSLDLPEGELVLASEPDVTAVLPPETAAWLRLPVPSLGRGRSARP